MTKDLKMPTDLEYLTGILQQNRDESWSRLMRNLYGSPELIDLLQMNSRSEDDKHILEELKGPFIPPEGFTVRDLKKLALRILGSRRDKAVTIPVGMLYTRNLNGYSILTPRMGSVILINHAVVFATGKLNRLYAGFYNCGAQQSCCSNHSQVDYANGLLALTRFIVTGKLDTDNQFLHLKCPTLTENDFVAESWYSHVMETFILLHEYAHILLGHLKPSAVVTRKLLADVMVRPYTIDQVKEFQADDFACKSIQEYLSEENLDNPFGYSIGLLFRFFDLCEKQAKELGIILDDDHPPSLVRWQTIKKKYQIGQRTEGLTAELDDAFDALLQWAGFPAKKP